MLLRLSKISLALLATLTLANCSSDDDAAATNAFATAKSALESAAPDVASSSSFVASPFKMGPRTAISSIISDPNLFSSPSGGSNDNSLVQYMEEMYSDSVDNAVFWRANTPFLIACTLDTLADKTGTTYNNGTQTMTINVALLSACGSATDYSGMDGQTVTAVFSTPADTTYFDTYIIMDGASNPVFGGNDQFMFVRNDGTTIHFAHYEMDDSGAPTEVSASWLVWDVASGSGRFQYISRGANSNSVYRINYDVANSDARVFTHTSITGGSNPTMTTSAASTAVTQTQAAFSFSWTNQGTGDVVDGNVCLNISGAASVSADNTLTCSGISKTVAAASTATPVITRALSTLSAADIAAYGITSAAGDGILPDFDDSNILTSVTGW